MRILKNLNLDNVVFIDIETVNAVKVLEPGTPLWDSWNYKMKYGREAIGGEDPVATYESQAALFAEFGKIVCITIGKIKNNELFLKSYVNDDEKVLLTEFCSTLDNICASNKATVLAGHAIKGFDIPWMMRRCIVNQVELPILLDTAHLKPWETTAIDTMDLWKAGGFTGGSLIAIAVALGLHNPKDELAGYQTSKVYYSEKDALAQIQKYCEKDVKTVANIVRKCRYEPIVEIASNTEVKEEQAPLLIRLFNGAKYSVKEAKVLSEQYLNSTEEEKQAMVTILQSIITKDTGFTDEHLQAIISYKPKTK